MTNKSGKRGGKFIYPDEVWQQIHERYHDEEESATSLAEEYSISVKAMYNAFKRLNLPVRGHEKRKLGGYSAAEADEVGDKLRDKIKEIVNCCWKEGIKKKRITGDSPPIENPETIEYYAQKIQLTRDSSYI